MGSGYRRIIATCGKFCSTYTPFQREKAVRSKWPWPGGGNDRFRHVSSWKKSARSRSLRQGHWLTALRVFTGGFSVHRRDDLRERACRSVTVRPRRARMTSASKSTRRGRDSSPNGAGKSTTMRTTLHLADGGRHKVRGHDVFDTPQVRAPAWRLPAPARAPWYSDDGAGTFQFTRASASIDASKFAGGARAVEIQGLRSFPLPKEIRHFTAISSASARAGPHPQIHHSVLTSSRRTSEFRNERTEFSTTSSRLAATAPSPGGLIHNNLVEVEAGHARDGQFFRGRVADGLAR